jgi:hypothetical protein
MKKTFNISDANPTAFITVKKQRQKQNGKNIYLHDKTEFEIELYNPTNDSVKATIELNGKSISTSGIVLKPGQRVFLERFLDIDRKFLFDTYDVDSNEINSKAIEDNGLVVVRFFTKFIRQYYDATNTFNATRFNDVFYTNTLDINKISCSLSKKIETGRVEMGDISNQSFGTSYETFNPWSSWVSEWKILPYSSKDLTTDDLVKKCGCGHKIKSNYKFCPQCGNQVIRTKTEIHYTLNTNVSINGKHYFMETYHDTLDNFLKRHENKLIYIKSDSLTENSLRAVVID